MGLGLAFQDALDVLAQDPSTSVSATFTPVATGIPVPCRVRIARRDPEITLGHTRARSPGWRVSNLRKSEVPTRPKANDRVTILEGEYAGAYLVHEVREISFSPGWEMDVGVAP